MKPSDMLQHSVIAGLTETENVDYGTRAGEEMVTLASVRGLDIESVNIYRTAMNHAAIADIMTSVIRKPDDRPWGIIPKSSTWNTSALADPSGLLLRRFLPVSTWNPERAQHEARSWFCTGETAMMGLPMQLVVGVLGPMNGGRRHGHWSKALLHPQHSSLRFKRRSRASIEGFKETFRPIWREENDQISREKWVSSMNEDDVIRDVLFVVDIPVPGELERDRIIEIAKRKFDAISMLIEVPEKQLSTCDGPLAPCPFRECCWGSPETAPTIASFDAVV